MEGVRQNRSPKAIAAANSFRQGHIVEVPGLFYAANLAEPIWDATLAMAEESAAAGDALGTELVVVDDPDLVKYGIITTQSCDVNEEFEPRKMPWIQLAPVYEAVGDHAGADNRNYTHRLKPPELEGDGPWVADIRLELPVEKGYLVGRAPIAAFPSEEREVKFSKWLAEMRGRPALGNIVNELVWGKLKELIQRDRQKSNEVKKLVYSTRLALPAGRLEPTEVQLHVILKPGVSQEEAEFAGAWFGDWWDQTHKEAAAAGVTLLPTVYHRADSANLQVIDALVAVRNPF